jgi:hypothetical protein
VLTQSRSDVPQSVNTKKSPTKIGVLICTPFFHFPSCFSLSRIKGIAQPIEAFIQTVPGAGAAALNVPLAIAKCVESELVGDLGHAHGVGQILLVGKHQQLGIAELILTKHLLQLFTRLGDALAIVRVNNKDEA